MRAQASAQEKSCHANDMAILSNKHKSLAVAQHTFRVKRDGRDFGRVQSWVQSGMEWIVALSAVLFGEPSRGVRSAEP